MELLRGDVECTSTLQSQSQSLSCMGPENVVSIHFLRLGLNWSGIIADGRSSTLVPCHAMPFLHLDFSEHFFLHDEWNDHRLGMPLPRPLNALCAAPGGKPLCGA